MAIAATLTILITFSAQTTPKLIELKSPQENSFRRQFVKDLIDEYKSFQKIFHHDNDSSYSLTTFLKTWSEKTYPSLIFNHDLNQTIKKPFLVNCLQVVSLRNPTQFANYLQIKQNVVTSDVVIFFVNTFDLEYFSKDFWFMPQLETTGNVLVVDLSEEKFIDVFRICFYCGKNSGRLVKIQTIRNNNEKISPEFLFLRKFDDFEGHTFKIAYLDYYPYAYREKNSTKITGIDPKLIEMLSRTLNFNYEFHKFEGNLDELVSKLDSGEFDLGIGGFSLNSEYFNQVQFSFAINFENVVAIFYYDTSFSFALTTFFVPFPVLGWIGIASGVVGMTLIAYSVDKRRLQRTFYVRLKTWHFYLTYYSSSGGKFRLYYSSSGGFVFPIRVVFMKILIEQPTKITCGGLKIRFSFIIFLSTWFLFCLLVGTSYKSRLVSILMKPPMRKSFTLRELQNDGYIVVTDNINSKNFENYVSTKFYEKLDTCGAIEHIRTHKSVYINEISRIFLHSQLFCPKIKFVRKWGSRFGFSQVGKTVMGWPFKIGTPFVKIIDDKLKHITSGGHLEQWRRQMVLTVRKNRPWKKFERESLSLTSYSVHFVLYLICVGVSTTVFLIEVCIKLIKNK